MNPRQYLERQQQLARQQTCNASGPVKRGFLNASGPYGNGPVLTNTNRWNNAGGGAPSNSIVPTSMPIVLQISNGSAGAVANFDIFGASFYLNTGIGTWAAGSWTNNNVTVSSLTPNVTYQAILGQTISKPFSTGQTILQAAAGSASLVTVPCSVTERQMNGILQSIPIITPYNTFQQVNNQIVSAVPYIINDSTTFTFTQIYGGSVLIAYFYPAMDLNMSNALAGGKVDSAYGNPGTQQQTVTLRQ